MILSWLSSRKIFLLDMCCKTRSGERRAEVVQTFTETRNGERPISRSSNQESWGHRQHHLTLTQPPNWPCLSTKHMKNVLTQRKKWKMWKWTTGRCSSVRCFCFNLFSVWMKNWQQTWVRTWISAWILYRQTKGFKQSQRGGAGVLQCLLMM